MARRNANPKSRSKQKLQQSWPNSLKQLEAYNSIERRFLFSSALPFCVQGAGGFDGFDAENHLQSFALRRDPRLLQRLAVWHGS